MRTGIVFTAGRREEGVLVGKVMGKTQEVGALSPVWCSGIGLTSRVYEVEWDKMWL